MHDIFQNGSISKPSRRFSTATITVKNIPDDLYERLKLSAKVNRRKISSEIIMYIERAVRIQKVNPETLLINARQLREKTTDYVISEEEFNQANNMGRK